MNTTHQVGYRAHKPFILISPTPFFSIVKLLFCITIKLINKSYNQYIKVTVFSLFVDDKTITKRFKNQGVFLNKMAKIAISSQITKILCCPECKRALKKLKTKFKCEKCKKSYEIKENIPVLMRTQ